MDYIVIGISNNSNFILSDEVKLQLSLHRIFSGGKRHYELIKEHLPSNHQWIEIKSHVKQLIEQYKQINKSIVIFASGDPLVIGWQMFFY